MVRAASLQGHSVRDEGSVQPAAHIIYRQDAQAASLQSYVTGEGRAVPDCIPCVINMQKEACRTSQSDCHIATPSWALGSCVVKTPISARHQPGLGTFQHAVKAGPWPHLFWPLLICPHWMDMLCMHAYALRSRASRPTASPTSLSPFSAVLPDFEHMSDHAVTARLQLHLFCSILLAPGSALPGLGTFIRMRPWKLPRSVCKHRPQEGSSASTV